MKKNLIILIVAIIVAGGVGFFGGMQFQKSTGAKVAATGFNRAGLTGTAAGQRTGTRNTANASGFTSGQILAKTDNSLTIKSATGGSEIVFLAASSQIMQSSTTTIASLNVGQNVMVTGTTNSDGTITAKTVQVGDFRLGGMGRTAGQGQAQTATTPASQTKNQTTQGNGPTGEDMPPPPFN
jgi:hypothetical protein